MRCFIHKWNGCTCVRCGEMRDEGHHWRAGDDKRHQAEMIVILLVNDTLLVNESPPTTENGALYQSIVGNTYKNADFDTMRIEIGVFILHTVAVRRPWQQGFLAAFLLSAVCSVKRKSHVYGAYSMITPYTRQTVTWRCAQGVHSANANQVKQIIVLGLS